ncbi:hypothetical protein [Streptomyces uncialis]|uniref:hypothetical protein n=1 Tax=Streptomyces uncialis TaxID=1048205 RepID=UPI003863CCF7|nr:hypothetical protein OG924_27585 [Streptomyces uncialis]
MTSPHSLAEELLDGIRRWAESRKWNGYQKKQVRLAELLAIFRGIYRAGPDSEPEEVTLNRWLTALTDSGWIKPMGRAAGEPLPPGIHLLPVREAPAPKQRRGTLPHPSLHRLLRGKRARTETQEVAYEAISDWLHALRGPAMDVPLRERALEIFGKRRYTEWFPEPEKCLDGKGFGGPLFEDRSSFFELVHAFRTDPPLLNARFPSFDPRAQSSALNGGDVLLVVENSATYTSLVERLHELNRQQHRIGCVAWGVGHSFTASVRSIKRHYGTDKRSGPHFRKIRYFGDLDTSGLQIPLRASGTAAAMGLDLQPTPVLYRDLLTVGTPLPGKESSTRAEAEDLVNWLGRKHDFRPVVDVLVKGERWAQEWVGRRHLRLTDDWLADMQ